MAGMLTFTFRPDFGRTFCPDWMPIDSLPAAFCTSMSGSRLSSPVMVTLNLSPRSRVTSNGPSTSTAVKSLASTLREAGTPEPAKPARPQPPTGTIATAVRNKNNASIHGSSFTYRGRSDSCVLVYHKRHPAGKLAAPTCRFTNRRTLSVDRWFQVRCRGCPHRNKRGFRYARRSGTAASASPRRRALLARFVSRPARLALCR